MALHGAFNALRAIRADSKVTCGACAAFGGSMDTGITPLVRPHLISSLPMDSVVGIDPGGRFTGVVRLNGQHLLSAVVLKRTSADDFPDHAYIDEVTDEISAQIEHADIIAVEGLSEPSSHINGELSIINVKGIMGVSMVFGAVMARWPRAIVVPPGGNGSLPDGAYPEAIRKYARLGGPTNHARSAYDVARIGRTMARALKGAR